MNIFFSKQNNIIDINKLLKKPIICEIKNFWNEVKNMGARRINIKICICDLLLLVFDT